MRVGEPYLRLAAGTLFLIAGIWACLVRGDGWPFSIQQVSLPQHAVQIAQTELDELLDAEEEFNPQRIIDLARRIAAHDPLSIRPYEAMLTVELERETVADSIAQAYAAAALRRDARSRVARLFLVDQAILNEDWEAAFEHFGKATEHWPSEATDMTDILYLSLEGDDWVDPLLRRVEQDTQWARFMVERMPADLTDFETLVKLHKPLKSLHEQLLFKIGYDAGLAEMHAAWRILQPNLAAEAELGLIDGNFNGSPAYKPFNWTFDRNFSELNREGNGLDIAYIGRGTPNFASQVMFLEPGKYVFHSEIAERPEEVPGDIVWRISCLTPVYDLFEASVFDPAFSTETPGMTLEIPESCEYQELNLDGVPGRFVHRLRLQIVRVAIAPEVVES